MNNLEQQVDTISDQYNEHVKQALKRGIRAFVYKYPQKKEDIVQGRLYLPEYVFPEKTNYLIGIYIPPYGEKLIPEQVAIPKETGQLNSLNPGNFNFEVLQWPKILVKEVINAIEKHLPPFYSSGDNICFQMKDDRSENVYSISAVSLFEQVMKQFINPRTGKTRDRNSLILSVLDTKSGRQVIMKINLKPEEIDLKKEMDEIVFLRSELSGSIVQPLGIFGDSTKYEVLILEKYTPLTEILESTDFTLTNRKAFLVELIKILEHVAFNTGQPYLDIKIENVLVQKQNDRYIPVLTDFGSFRNPNHKAISLANFTDALDVNGLFDSNGRLTHVAFFYIIKKIAIRILKPLTGKDNLSGQDFSDKIKNVQNIEKLKNLLAT